MRTVLFIVNQFPPFGGGGIIRPLKFVKYLPDFGWKPIVVSCDYLGNIFTPDVELCKEIPELVDVYRVKSYEPNSLKRKIKNNLQDQSNDDISSNKRTNFKSPILSLTKGARDVIYKTLIPDEHILWVPGAVKKCKQILAKEKIDVLLTTSPPVSTHLVGLLLKKKFPQLPWVVDFRDLWTIYDPYHQNKIVFARRINEYLETIVLKNSNKSIFVSDDIEKLTREKFNFINKNKSICITNGFDPHDFNNNLKDAPADKFQISYTGSMLRRQAQNKFLEGLKEFIKNSNHEVREKLKINLVGKFENFYLQKIKGYELQNYINVIEFVNHRKAINFMNQSHLLVLILSDDYVCKFVLTGKFFEYLASQKPILALVPDGIVSNIIQRNKLGIVVNPDDVEGIKNAISAFYKKYKQNDLGIKVQEEFLRQFDRKELTRKLADVLNKQIENEN